MFVWTFLFRITHTIISQSNADSSWITLYIRRLLKIFWPVQISNQVLWARAKQKPIKLEIRQRKCGWLGYTLRLPPSDIAKAALEWNPQGTRSRGRPEQHDEEQSEEIRHQAKTCNEVRVLASNRVRWRNFVRALCSLEEWRECIYIYRV